LGPALLRIYHGAVSVESLIDMPFADREVLLRDLFAQIALDPGGR